MKTALLIFSIFLAAAQANAQQAPLQTEIPDVQMKPELNEYGQWTDKYQAYYDTCKAYYNFASYYPRCQQLTDQAKHHLVLEADINSACGAAEKFKKDTQEKLALFQKLSHVKQLRVSKCPMETRY